MLMTPWISYEENSLMLQKTLQHLQHPHCAKPGKNKSMGMNGRAGKLGLHQNNGGIPIESICNMLSYKDVLKYFWSIRIIQNFEKCNENWWFKKSILLNTTDFLISLPLYFHPLLFPVGWLETEKDCLFLLFGAEIASYVCANLGKEVLFLFGIFEWHCKWYSK